MSDFDLDEFKPKDKGVLDKLASKGSQKKKDPKKMGRPLRGKEPLKSFSVSLTESEIESLKKIADDMGGVPVATLVRRAIKKEFNI